MDDAVKETLLEQFRQYLDGVEVVPEAAEAAGSEADLFTVFVELAGLRTEVRTESRLVKDALDKFGAVFATLQSSQAALEQELKRVHAEARDRERALLRPLLLELLELRDRLAAGLQHPVRSARWLDRILKRRQADAESWREGIAITLRRLDRILADRRVMPIEMIGQPFDAHRARVVGTTRNAAFGAGIVVEDVRTGFLWADELLRVAEVIVNAADSDSGERVS